MQRLAAAVCQCANLSITTVNAHANAVVEGTCRISVNAATSTQYSSSRSLGTLKLRDMESAGTAEKQSMISH